MREFNTPTNPKNIDKVLGFFVQDAWSVGRKLTLNLGVRYDHNIGTLPEQSNPGGPFVAPRSIPESTPINQNIFVWRTGAVLRSDRRRPARRSRRATAATACRWASIA